MTYWIGFFLPIAQKRLREPYGYRLAYIDTMAGSGVTETKRAGYFLCGSCPSAILTSLRKDIPFDLIIGVEKNRERAQALEERLKEVSPSIDVKIFNKDILEVSKEIADEIKTRTISFIVIDPQALQGMTWDGISPLLSCKGDVMITWFEQEAWRLKEAASSKEDHPSIEGDKARLTELLGSEEWKNLSRASDLTDMFIGRILNECDKETFAKVKIVRETGHPYWMTLFTKDEKLVNEWKKSLERRIESSIGKGISSLFDVKAGRLTSLNNYR